MGPPGPRASPSPVMPVVPGSILDSTSRTMTTMEMSEAHPDTRLSPVESEATEPLDELEKPLDETVQPSDLPEQPQASTAMDWRQTSKTRHRKRFSSNASSMSGRRSSVSPELSAEKTMENAELAAAFAANSQLLKTAIESLETALMASTESAIRRSMALVEFAINTELGHHRNAGRGNISSMGSTRNSIYQKEPTKWTSLFPSTNYQSEEAGAPHRRSSRRCASAGVPPGHFGADRNTATPSSASATHETPKESEDNARPVIEDMGERIHRSRRRVNTHDVPMHFSRRTARHSFANAHLQFSAKV